MAANELISRTIDDHEYSFQKLGAKKSLALLVRLARICGGPIATVVASLGGEKGGKVSLDKNLDTKILGSAIASLTDRLDQSEVVDLMEEFCARSNLLCDGKRVESFDKHYEGKLDHMFRVFVAALEVQYGNFSNVVTAVQGFAVRNATTPETTQSTG